MQRLGHDGLSSLGRKRGLMAARAGTLPTGSPGFASRGERCVHEAVCSRNSRLTTPGAKIKTERALTLVIQGIQRGISSLFCHMSHTLVTGTPGTSTVALRS